MPIIGEEWEHAGDSESLRTQLVENRALSLALEEKTSFTVGELRDMGACTLAAGAIVETPSGRLMRPVAIRDKTVRQWDTILQRMGVEDDDSDDGDSWKEGTTLHRLRQNARRNLEKVASLIPLSHLPDDLKAAHAKATERYGTAATLPFAPS